MTIAIREWKPMTERSSAVPGFGPYIRSLRDVADLTQREVANRIGMSQSQYSGIEAKANRGYLPAPEVVSGLARVYGVSEASLLQAAGYLTDADVSTATSTGDVVATLHQLQQVKTVLTSFEGVLSDLLTRVAEKDARIIAAEQQPLPVPKEVGARRQRATG